MKSFYASFSCSNGAETLLHDIQCIADKGEFIALVGASGSGKTSFLEAVSGRMKKPCSMHGHFMVDGVVIPVDEMKKNCCYVTCKEALLPYITVEETFDFAMQLMQSDVPAAQRELRIHHVLQQLHLFDCRRTLVGNHWRKGISTGERHRVQIGISLLSNADILVIDEPTTGLDSYTALQLIRLLKMVARSGFIVICSLQQPPSFIFSVLDTVVLLSFGRVVYHGKAATLRDHFKQLGFHCQHDCNILDFVVDLIVDDFSLLSDSVSWGMSFPSNAALCTTVRSETPVACRDTVCSPSSDFFHVTPPTISNHPANVCHSDGPLDAKLRSVSFFVEKFKTSPAGLHLTQRIEALHRVSLTPTSSFHCNTNAEKKKKMLSTVEGFTSTMSGFLYQTPILCKRFFKNNIRCPAVYSLIWLMHLMQGVCLGVIFWQLTKTVRQQKPWRFDYNQTSLNSWLDTMTNGLQGDHPFLDSLNIGVDGNQSQPLAILVGENSPLNILHSVVSCASLYQPFMVNYSSFSLGRQPDWTDGQRLQRSTKPREVLYNIIALLQTADHLRSVAPTKKDSLTFWTDYYHSIHTSILKPYSHCTKIFTKFTPPKENKSAPQRLLLSIGDTSLYEFLISAVGPSVPRTLYAIRHYLNHMTTCSYPYCTTVKGHLTTLKVYWRDFLSATTSLVNVSACLFLVVGTLGFTSFDALTVLPQDKHMHTYEIANGFYTPLTYFVARNLSSLPFEILPPLVFATFFYLMAGLGTSFSHYLIYAVVCIGVTFSAYGFGHFLSTLLPIGVAILVAPATLVVWLALSGFFLHDSVVPPWIQCLSILNFYKWGFFSLVRNQFGSSPDAYFGVLPSAIPRFITGLPNVGLPGCVFRLYGIGFLYRFFAYLLLHYQTTRAGVSSSSQ